MSDTAIITQKRRPRFHRAEEPPCFQLTERDVEIVRQVARHRFLRSTHISQLLGAPHKKICERLTQLYHAQYLDRPRSQLEYHARRGGSAPYVYALGNLGARLLREHDGVDQTNVDWARKNHDSTRRFLLHTLSVAEFRVALAVACRTRPGLRLVEPDELLLSAPKETQETAVPWRWRVRVQFKENISDIGVAPDYVFALVLPDGRRRPIVVECDRGTMPIERSLLTQTSMLRKLLAYEASRTQGLHTSRFGWKNFRVLIVTAGQERLENMRTLIKCRSALDASPLFLLGEQSTLTQSGLLTFFWSNSSGSAVSLI